MDCSPPERPTKKHRTEQYVRPSTPEHRILEDPPTCPANRRKPTRSESTESSTSTLEFCPPCELVFFDDEFDGSRGCTASHISCTPPQFWCASQTQCSTEEEDRRSLGRYSYGVGRSCSPPASIPGHYYPHPPAHGHISGWAEGPPTQAASGHPMIYQREQQGMVDLDGALEWQNQTSNFFRQIDARALRLAPAPQMNEY